MRRSVTGSGTSRAAAGGGAAAGCSPRGAPQSPQKRWPAGFVAPHAEQTAASAPPQEPQKRWPAGFSAPQDAQAVTSEA
jgi:hypothetical protein